MRDNGVRKADDREVKKIKQEQYKLARNSMQDHLEAKSKMNMQDEQHKLVH